MGVPSRALERLQPRLLPENVKQTSNKKKTSEMTSSEYARTSKPMLEICHCETQTYKNESVPHRQNIFLISERKELELQGKKKKTKHKLH